MKRIQVSDKSTDRIGGAESGRGGDCVEDGGGAHVLLLLLEEIEKHNAMSARVSVMDGGGRQRYES